jgi:hypothetical protein
MELLGVDALLPRSALERETEVAATLQKVNSLIASADALLGKRHRVEAALAAEPRIKRKFLRVFIRHEYRPSTPQERAHFVLFVDGVLLDPAYSNPLGQFFDRISVQVGKGQCEWSDATCPEGAAGESFSMRLSHDKNCLARVYLHRCDELRARFNISDQLRVLLPNLQVRGGNAVYIHYCTPLYPAH